MAHSDKIIWYPIHGFVKLSPWEQDIIDHPVFQRPRHRRRLSRRLSGGAVGETLLRFRVGKIHLVGSRQSSFIGGAAA